MRRELWLVVLNSCLDDGIDVDQNLLAGNLFGKVQQAGDQYARAPDLMRNFGS
jgi:hypothetical protein